MKNKSHIKAVLFDFDGTLTQPGAIDFQAIKDAIKCPAQSPILEYIATIDDTAERTAALSVIHRFEMTSAIHSRPNTGAEKLIHDLRSHRIKIGILSRNGLHPIKRSLENFTTIRYADFDIVISRDTPVAPKPSPDGIAYAARTFGFDTSNILIVGDYIFDIQAGNRAGSITALLTTQLSKSKLDCACDYVISHLAEVNEILFGGIEN